MEKTASSEFMFLRDKLQKISLLIVNNEINDTIEAAFMLGCLHTVCHENIALFADTPSQEDALGAT